MTTQIKCDECDIFLFAADTEKWGAIGCEAQDKGFIYKLPILYTNKYERLFFCSKECQKAFYDKNIPKDKEVTETSQKMKAEIPDMAKEVCHKMAVIVDKLKKT